MNVPFNNRKLIFLLLALLSAITGTFGQVAVKSAQAYTKAYSVLNAGTTTRLPVAYVGNASAGINNASTGIKAVETHRTLGYIGPLDKKWNINFGIPYQIGLEYNYLKSHMQLAWMNNPDMYNNGSQVFRDAVAFVGWADFSPISEWKPVRCTVTFRFLPPLLNTAGNLDYRLNPSLAPEKGKLTFWIR